MITWLSCTRDVPQEAITKELSRHESRNQQAIIMDLRCDESCCSAGNHQAAEQAGIRPLSWQFSSWGPRRYHEAQLAIFKQLSRKESCTSIGPGHVTQQALFTWLIIHWSRDWLCTDHMAIIYWSLDCACIDHVDDYTLITWLIMHWSCDCPCNDHVDDHTLITLLIKNWSRDG